MAHEKYADFSHSQSNGDFMKNRNTRIVRYINSMPILITGQKQNLAIIVLRYIKNKTTSCELIRFGNVWIFS